METDKREKSLADQLYEKITDVTGGNNPNQFFCVGLPGTAIDTSHYTYDLESSAPKPLHVTANESKLVDKLFDACYTGASDDGGHLQTLHRDAPDIFTPKMKPAGEYAYPVPLYPQHWSECLDISFTLEDLLGNPSVLAQQLTALEMRRNSITANLIKYLMTAPEEVIAGLKKAYRDCEVNFQNELKQYTSTIPGCTDDMLKTLVDIAAENGTNGNKKLGIEVPSAIIGRILHVDTTQIDGLLETLNNTVTKCIGSHNALVQVAANTTEVALEWMKANNMVQLQQKIEPIKRQLDEVNEEIVALQTKINRAIYEQPEIQQTDDKQNMSDRFTRIVINSKMSEVKQKLQHASTALESGDGVSVFSSGCTSDSSHRSAVDNALKESADMEIQIEMSVANVPMEQGLFLPRVPDSLVIAKDVTIQFYSQSGISASFAKTVEEHSAKGAGFFIFGGNNFPASSPAECSSFVTSTANSVTVHFTSSQILGYYLEKLPETFPDY